MKLILRTTVLSLLLMLSAGSAWADKFTETQKMFTDAGIAEMFDSAYAYALFPTIGKGGFVVGGAYGEGRVFEQGAYIGDTRMSQATIGLQIGGAGFSQVVFFENKPALEEFTHGNFEFGAKFQAVALTASADHSANTIGSSATASGGKNNAIVDNVGYQHGMAIYTITKGGMMLEASIGGQKFSFEKR